MVEANALVASAAILDATKPNRHLRRRTMS
jgi:hypothetical protein